MAAKETDPIERQSYSKLLFVFGTIFLLVSVWAFYDEIVSRRSWKQYQREFNVLELKKVDAEYEKTKKEIEAEDQRRDQLPDPVTDEKQLSLRRIRLKIEEAQIRMEGEDFQKAQKEIHERKIRLEDAKQRFGFAKADQDETYYEWKHALEEGQAEEAEKYKKGYYELEAKLKDLKQKVGEAEASVAEVQTTIDRYASDLKKWQDFEKNYFDPLKKLDKKIEGIRARSLDIKQVVVNDLGKGGAVVWGSVDRCESCHVAINRDGFENEKNPFKTHPHHAELLKAHPPEEFGCTTCHQGQGRATQIKGKPLEEGDFTHGFVEHWKEPLLRGDAVQSSCNKCHQDQWNLPHAPVDVVGKKLFWGLGCTGCHNYKGFEDAPKMGPSLRRVADKVPPEWMIAWIKDPKAFRPKTKMPKPPLDIDEPGQTEKIAAYILQSSEPFALPFGRYPGGNAGQGEKLFEQVGCLGCHSMGEKGTGLAAALDRIGEKTSADWIYNWIQDPKKFNPNARMPNLRLTPQEAADITAYLSKHGEPPPEDAELRTSLQDPEKAKQGFLLISQYGCYGCHDIKGFENTSKLSVELTAFGKKDPLELDFGDTKVPRTWDDWTKGKLKDPRMYLTEKTSSKMPNFGLSEEQIHALTTFLKGSKKEEVPDRFILTKKNPHQKEIDDGRRLVERLNCKGCHLIEGEGRLIEEVVGPDKAPPNLMGIGARVRPDWMFAFLKDPSRIKLRPWIDVRMPTFAFSDDQANTIIRYFSALEKVPAQFTEVPHTPPDPESLAAGTKLVSPQYFSCFSCHIQAGKTPAGIPTMWGPDLALARQRIRYDFIPQWVKDPQSFTPGVKMPAFLPSDEAAVPDILGGNRQKQAEALRDYLMNLGK